MQQLIMMPYCHTTQGAKALSSRKSAYPTNEGKWVRIG
jgi:hypothetical protein